MPYEDALATDSESVAGRRMRLTLADRLLMAAVQGQRIPGVGFLVRQWLEWRGTGIPIATLAPGHRLVLTHGGHVAVHYTTRIGNDVVLLHNVTIGRGDLWLRQASDFGGVRIEDGVMLGAGATVLVSHGTITLGRRSIVGANSVLTRSTGPGEIWAGNPAVRIGHRDDPST